ncbi:uncharacterized protein LOC110092794 isoform X2 [Dendrobium catenatum]|uniref:uncharacterized protein LOC110092794 isoform X2 n=1 Tax=Dendrobium catenatum TaxID=906689 RepID=UPI00109F56BF|nr:uncharacterized protein LOC110092794 isoform X2 [Dendrobium catenatum]
MAENVQPSSPNPCCALWIKRSQKLEKSRDALRQSVKILEGQIEKQSVEIASLKKGAENHKMQRGQLKDESKEANIKKDLEKQIVDLKVKISSLENIRSLKSNDEDELGMLKARISAGQEEVKSLKELLEKERRKADSEGRKTESEKKKATEAWKLLKDEKKKADEHKCLLEAEKKKSEDLRLCLEKLKVEANELREKLSAEIAKSYDARKQIEVEKLKAHGEKKRADSERKKAKKQKMLIEEERKRVLDLKKQANDSCQMLEEERRKRKQIQKKLEDLSVVCNFGDRESSVCKGLTAAELKLLKKQLKLERKRVKHAERVAKQEKYEKRVVVREVHLLKQNIMQILYRLNMLDGLVSHNVGITDDVQKTLNYPDLTCFKLNDLLCSMKDDFDSHAEFGASEIQYGDPFTYAMPLGECMGLPVSRGCCSKPKTGINSELESPVGGSLRKKSQSSAVCSTSIHFSDRKLMGSQGRDSVVEISTTKLAEKAKHDLSIEKFPSEAAQIGMLKGCQVGAKDTVGSTALNEVEKPCSNSSTYKAVAQVSANSSKKRKIEICTKSLRTEDKLHQVNRDKVTTVNDRMRNLKQVSLANCSQIPAAFDIDNEKFSQKEGQSDPCKNNYDHIKKIASTSHQTEKSAVKRGDRKNAGKSMSKYSLEPCCVQAAGPVSSSIDLGVTSLSNKKSSLRSFENMISGGCLKLLELDNYSDEVRFMNALEVPLSPTLPEIVIPNFQLDGEDISYAVMVRDNPVPPCSFNIMDLENASINSKSKIVTKKELSNNNTTQHDVFHDITRDTCLADNSESIIFEHGYDPREPKTRSDQKYHGLKHFPAEHKKIELEVVPVSIVINDTFSRGYEKSQPSPDEIGIFSEPSHSQLFHECGHSGSSAIDNSDSTSHLSSCVVKLSKELRGCQQMNSDFIKNQSEVKTVIDPVFVQGLNRTLPSDTDKLTKGNSLTSAEEGTEHNIQQKLESGLMSTVPNISSSYPDSKVKSPSKDENYPGRIIRSFTSFSSARNTDSMSRIISSFNSVTPQNLMVSKTDLLIVEVLDGLQLEDLQSEEKVAVFFSLLLANLSERMSDHCKHIVDEDSFQFLESFSMEIVRAVSSGKTKYVLDQTFHLDILFCLMESFLIAREVLVIGDVKQHSSSFPAFPDCKFHLDVGNNCVLSQDVTISQFIAGCTVLASICVAADDIGVLLVFSHKLLQTFHNDITWVLLALHVFANIFGKRFFNLDNYSFLVTTIKSVVLLLEGRLKLVSYPPPCCLNSTSRMVVEFAPCKQCPFAVDAICMEKLLSFQLDALEDYSFSGDDHSNTIKYFVSLNGSAPTRDTEDKDSSDAKSKFDVQCDASCAIFRYRELAGNQPDRRSEAVFCDFIDIISLVELVGHYMGWEWMYNEAVPRLLKMLEACVCEEFLAALFVLVGELGRHGCNSGGYEQAGIAGLRSRMIKLLDNLIARKASFPTQVAAVVAMLNLLPLELEDIISEHREITLDSSESPYIKHIQEWFFKLSGEQQLALKSVFDNENHLRSTTAIESTLRSRSLLQKKFCSISDVASTASRFYQVTQRAY